MLRIAERDGGESNGILALSILARFINKNVLTVSISTEEMSDALDYSQSFKPQKY